MERRYILKRLLILTVCFAFLLGVALSSFAVCQKIGDVAPGFELEELNSGELAKLSDYKGKVILLTFWATWCPRCWEELDYIKARFENEDRVAVLLVNMETQSLSPLHVKKIKKKAKEHQIKFPMFLDKRLKVWELYCVNSLPTTLVLDKEGKVAFVEPNFYFESREKIEDIIKDLLK